MSRSCDQGPLVSHVIIIKGEKQNYSVSIDFIPPIGHFFFCRCFSVDWLVPEWK